jgi:outer membrane protein assembly factor BamB
MGGFRENILQAISLDRARGAAAVSNAVLWELTDHTPYVPSPLLYGGLLYFLKTNTNRLSCYDAGTGAPCFTEQPLEGITGVYASPVAARDRVYVAGRNGVTVVLKLGTQPAILAQNKLDDHFDASPAIAGQELYLRGHAHLYCIAQD